MNPHMPKSLTTIETRAEIERNFLRGFKVNRHIVAEKIQWEKCSDPSCIGCLGWRLTI